MTRVRLKGGMMGYTPLIEILKSADFVRAMLSRVLHDLPFSRNEPSKSAYEQHKQRHVPNF